MTKEFDIIVEQPISVENQIEEKVGEKLLDWDDRKGRISWRSDGEYYVLSFINSDTNSRKFQVFNREGLLHSTIEKNVSVLDSVISWKYSKSLIASSIYRLNKHEVIFFERNGLAHGGFTLPFALNQMKVMGIYWNLDSSILCVWSEKVGSESSQYESVGKLNHLFSI